MASASSATTPRSSGVSRSRITSGGSASAHAGTLISALLLLTCQKWRASLNRFAETMTLFAASMAGLFPIFHLGRPYYVYWIIPYPNVQGLWPQWRSALVWDFWAVGTYITFSALFWYVGPVPDLAMLRERAVNRGVRTCTEIIAGAPALMHRLGELAAAIRGSSPETLAAAA